MGHPIKKYYKYEEYRDFKYHISIYDILDDNNSILVIKHTCDDKDDKLYKQLTYNLLIDYHKHKYPDNKLFKLTTV